MLEKDRPRSRAHFAAACPTYPAVTGDATTAAANEPAVAAARRRLRRAGHPGQLRRGLRLLHRPGASSTRDALDEAFDEMFAVNVKSQLHAVKAALPAPAGQRTATVVLTESTSAYYPGRGGVLYVSSKFAVRGLVTTLAYELAPAHPRQRRRARRHAEHRPARPGEPGPARTPPRRHAPAGRRNSPPGFRSRSRCSGHDHAWSYVFLASDRSRGHHRASRAPRRRDRREGLTQDAQTRDPQRRSTCQY